LGEYLKTPLETPYLVGRMQTPNQAQTPVTGETQTRLCITEGGYQGTTHVKYVYVFFSVKKNKFIKPMRGSGDRVVGKYMYELFPGQYVLIGYDSRSKEEPPRTVIAQLVTIDSECKEHYGDALIIRFENFEWVEKQDLPAPLKDIINWAPGYHSRPNIDFNKTYPQGDVQKLLEMITKKVRITEGEEHE
jgi:hypothetical protein